MGKKLVIKGADFSLNGINEQKVEKWVVGLTDEDFNKAKSAIVTAGFALGNSRITSLMETGVHVSAIKLVCGGVSGNVEVYTGNSAKQMVKQTTISISGNRGQIKEYPLDFKSEKYVGIKAGNGVTLFYDNKDGKDDNPIFVWSPNEKIEPNNSLRIDFKVDYIE